MQLIGLNDGASTPGLVNLFFSDHMLQRHTVTDRNPFRQIISLRSSDSSSHFRNPQASKLSSKKKHLKMKVTEVIRSSCRATSLRNFAFCAKCLSASVDVIGQNEYFLKLLSNNWTGCFEN